MRIAGSAAQSGEMFCARYNSSSLELLEKDRAELRRALGFIAKSPAF
jgi:hypothetical protein